MTDRKEIHQFCPACFADEKTGSWNHVVIPTSTGGYCTNCGNGSTVLLPAWAIESIREQASWVGRRYYPGEEDREIQAERQALLNLVVAFPGRSVEPDQERGGYWHVEQIMPTRGKSMTTVQADSAAEAMRKCCLRYVSETELLTKRPAHKETGV